MTKSEEKALEAYPVKMVSGPIGYGEPKFDINGLGRTIFIEGYEQAEKDLLSNTIDAEIVRDIHNLLHVKSAALPMPAKHKFGDKVKIIILPDETDNR